MDSSKIMEECSSSESGWTTYIASPEDTEDHDHEDDDDDEDDDVGLGGERGYKKEDDADEEEDVDSDDSMASDASSGPSDQGHLYGHHARNRDDRKYVGKKHNQQQEEKKKKLTKAEKDKAGSGHNRVSSAGKSKKNI